MTKNPPEDVEVELTHNSCGIIMPISEIDGCSEKHWEDVYDILVDACEKAGVKASLVSEGNATGIIHKRIVQNIYTSDIIVCDVSRKNPNVMFELGMRLAFDKPVVIIKDEKTNYSFDTSPIEHITYPSDLRYQSIVRFKEELAEKIVGTLDEAKKDKDFSPFLRHFGSFKTVNIETQSVNATEFLVEELRQLRSEIGRISARPLGFKRPPLEPPFIDICLARLHADGSKAGLSREEVVAIVRSMPGVSSAQAYGFGNHSHIAVGVSDPDKLEDLRRKITRSVKDFTGLNLPVRLREQR